MRLFIISSGIGFEKSSYSLQYSHERLQRRIGMMCAMMGWSVEASPLAIILSSRRRRFEAMTRRRVVCDDFSILSNFYYNTLTWQSRRMGSRAGIFGGRAVL